MTHPIYTAIAATDGTARLYGAAPIRWVGLADTARLVRAELARRWPAVRFYVRSSSYSGGSSIDVRYDGRTGYAPLESCYCAGGPTVSDAYGANQCRVCGYIGRLAPIYRDGAPIAEDVRDAIAPFASRGFDGSIDLSYGREAWLAPDGTVSFASTEGTEGSRGNVPSAVGSRHHASALLVRFGASHVFVEPELPYDVARKRGAAHV